MYHITNNNIQVMINLSNSQLDRDKIRNLS